MNREQHEQIVTQEREKQLDILFPQGEGRVSRHAVERALSAVAQRAFEQGRIYALSSLLTVEDLAAEFGVSTRRVRALARVAHSRWGTGWQTPGGEWLFTPEEVESLRPGDPGRRKNHTAGPQSTSK